MAIATSGRIDSADGRIFCITHSDRPASLDKCDLNYLEERYSRLDRLPPTEPFSSLAPSKAHSPFGGEISIYSISRSVHEPPRLIARLRPETFKPQHAVWDAGLLWVVGVEHVEIYGPDLKSIARVEDPWLAGGHTIASDGRGNMLVSCSASDSVIIIDSKAGRVIDALRMPEELYGRNYSLSRSDSVVDHYIINDAQLTHVNCAWPWKGGVLTSSLIPGALGWFSPGGEHRELLRGFVGCHGARVRSDDGSIYFCDSALGALVFLDSKMRIAKRVATGSLWLHDAIQIDGDVFALAVYDSSEVRFMDVVTRKILHKLDVTAFGGPQFLSIGA